MSDTTELLPTDAAPQAVTEPDATAAPEIQTEQPAEQVTKTFSQEEDSTLSSGTRLGCAPNIWTNECAGLSVSGSAGGTAPPNRWLPGNPALLLLLARFCPRRPKGDSAVARLALATPKGYPLFFITLLIKV